MNEDHLNIYMENSMISALFYVGGRHYSNRRYSNNDRDRARVLRIGLGIVSSRVSVSNVA